MIVGGGGSACHHGLGTLVTLQAVRGFSSVIVVIDKRQVHGMTYGQLAAYVAPVGLAQVYPDAHDGAVPTILWLSQGAPHPPQHLTAWDRALLYGLYNTNQASGMQLSEINLSVLRAIER